MQETYSELFEFNQFFDEAIFFVPYRYSDCYSIIKLSDKIFAEMQNQQIKKKKSKFKDHLKKIFCNLVIAYKEQKCLIISRMKEYYNTQLEDYTTMINILDYLIENEYIGQKLGFTDYQTKKGKKTRIWAKNKLIDLFNQYGIKSSDIKNRAPFTEVVIRDDKKQPIEIDENDFIKELKYRIGQINTEYSKHSIKMLDEYIFPRIQAIYSRESIKCGGRLYDKPQKGMNFQTASKEARKTITIDDEKTVEVDYSGLHVNMLYALENIQYPLEKSPYDFWIKVQIDKSENNLETAKKQAKKAMFTLMNAKSVKDALWVLNESDWDVDWENLIDLMMKEHSAIKKYIGSDMGIKLQNLDSKMMLDIIDDLHSKDILCLGIHDSVIVKEKDKETAIATMKRIYKEHLGYNINIK